MHYSSDTFSNEENVVVVVPVTCVEDEVTCSEAILALIISTLFAVFDEETGKVSTRVNCRQNIRLVSLRVFQVVNAFPCRKMTELFCQ